MATLSRGGGERPVGPPINTFEGTPMSAAKSSENAKSTTSATGGKYLTFTIGDADYGVEIRKVREIIGFMDVAPVANTPAHVKGAVNLRGQIISVIDLRAKLGFEPTAATEEACIIVVEVNQQGGKRNAGILVDWVTEVLTVPAAGQTAKNLLDIDLLLANENLLPLATQSVERALAA